MEISRFHRELARFFVITQTVVVNPYRRFETTHRYHLQGSRVQTEFLNLEDGTDRLSRNVVKELPPLSV